MDLELLPHFTPGLFSFFSDHRTTQSSGAGPGSAFNVISSKKNSGVLMGHRLGFSGVRKSWKEREASESKTLLNEEVSTSIVGLFPSIFIVLLP